MGRNAAGESFINGFLKHSKSAEFWIQVQSSDHAKDFLRKVSELKCKKQVQIINKSSLSELSKSGTLFFPGPDISENAFHRQFFGAASWSICGITHTTSSAKAMDAVVDLITSPLQPWDAIICTSNSVQKNVEILLQSQVDYLKDRLGITKFTLPKFPIIPLGINTSDFNFSQSQISECRDKLRIKDRSIVVLYMGRLSFHAKAHPLGMYQALEKAAKNTDKEIVLIECGWHANQFTSNAFEEASVQECPSVRVINLDGRKSEDRNIAWACANVFCSLSDNIQETFGITPIEAMARGIPVVVSDWDGYKDTVRNKIDGFLIPTTMPKSGLGQDLAYRHSIGLDTYDMYCGYTCSLISVDIDATANAFQLLFQSTELRERMGKAGQKRVRENYDWKIIIPMYERLWEELNELRRDTSEINSISTRLWPARQDPFNLFSGYPSQELLIKTQLELVDENWEKAYDRLKSLRNLKMVSFASYIFPLDEEIIQVLKAAENKHNPVSELIAEISKDRKAVVFRGISWLLKIGVFKKIN